MVLSWRSILLTRFSSTADLWSGWPYTLDGLLPDSNIPEVYVKSLHVLLACIAVEDGRIPKKTLYGQLAAGKRRTGRQ